jgi:predicted nuclease of predicted toxin-antitoxin system
LKVKIDENLPAEAADVLRDGGHDALSVLDEYAAGTPDADVAAGCRREARALLTSDLGFADIASYPPGKYAGLIVLRLHRQSKWQIMRAIDRLIPLLSNYPLAGRLWIVDEIRVRIRG